MILYLITLVYWWCGGVDRGARGLGGPHVTGLGVVGRHAGGSDSLVGGPGIPVVPLLLHLNIAYFFSRLRSLFFNKTLKKEAICITDWPNDFLLFCLK